jgi:hypothetical protein
MNVEDTKAPLVNGDRLTMIFDRQRELMVKYHEIEKKNGIGAGGLILGEFHIDDPRCQYVCKDFAWRVTEELAEAMEAGEPIHMREEAIDALHFLIELLLMVGITLKDIVVEFDLIKTIKEGRVQMIKPAEHLDLLWAIYESLNHLAIDEAYTNELVFDIVFELGLAMNCLKNKPWKQTQMATDRSRFKKHLLYALQNWFNFAYGIKMNDGDVFDLYFRKSEVNKFRQRSNY